MLIWKWLRQAIGDVHLSANLPDFELFLSYELSDVMKPYLNVFRLRVVDWMLDEVYCTLRVAKDGRCWMVESSFRREVGRLSMQQHDFLHCVPCCYVLNLCGRQGRALLKFRPP